MKHHTKGFSMIERIILVGVILTLVVIFQSLVAQQRRTVRDAQRLSIIRQAEAGFSRIFVKTGSFQSAAANGCNETDEAISECNFEIAGMSAAEWNDPGKERITVTVVPDSTTYEITFSLEGAYGDLTKGVHTLSPKGVE